jgi:1,4-dihydroxy-6-naphthoate synthase
MKQNLTLGYSTCPNDTFIFYALAHNLIERRGLQFKIELKHLTSRQGQGFLIYQNYPLPL